MNIDKIIKALKEKSLNQLPNQDIEDLIHFLEGMEGETIIRNIFKNQGRKFFQVDLVSLLDGNYEIDEIKNQEIFKPPPFYGHGLPRWQVDARIKFYGITGIIPYLYIINKNSNIICYQSFIELEKGDHYDTKGIKPRRVYPIENFNIEEI